MNELKVVATWNSEHACLENTRTAVLQHITRWVYDIPECGPNQPFFISGLAGSGKTAVSNTIAALCYGLGNLGATFFFDRATAGQNNPQLIFRSVARELAAYDPKMEQSVFAALEKDPGLVRTNDLRRQFQCLIRDPCYAAASGGPLVLIIDALDECADRDVLLHLFTTEFSTLPGRFRVILTGRLEPDIPAILAPAVVHYSLPHRGNDVLSDIHAFIIHQMNKVKAKKNLKVEDGWPGPEACQELVDMSAGLFIWAKIACDFIGGALSPQKRLAIVLSKTSFIAENLDGLYALALQEILNQDAQHSFGIFMGVIMVAKVPLSADAINALVDQYEDDLDASAHELLRLLGALLEGVEASNTPVKTLHPSFHDFLTTETRSRNFYIPKVSHNVKLALGCFKLLNAQLRQNMCDLPHDGILLTDIEEVKLLCLSEELRYACCFGIEHLLQIAAEDVDAALAQVLTEFFDEHLLHWMEVLSLIKNFDSTNQLRKIALWLEVC